MKKTFRPLILASLAAVVLAGCKDEKDVFSTSQISDYVALAPGKYIIYRLDSLKYEDFGQKQTTVTYQARDLVDAAITDNLGRPAWRVIRSLRDSAGTKPWATQSVYMMVADKQTLESIENNLRFQKLKIPFKDDFSWKGNSFIDTYSIFSDVRFFDDWDYTYSAAEQPYQLPKFTIENSVTVNHRDEMLGTPENLDAYSERNFSTEVYGKGIGLVYKEFVHWVFQPRNSTYPYGYKEGYGIKLTMLDHN